MFSNEDQRSKTANIALWVLQGLLAAMFLMAGMSKLSGQEMMVENFQKIGLGQWFRYLTGAVEVVAAILLVVPRLSAVGAGLLVCTMIGASVAHFTTLGGSAIPPMVLGSMAAIILFGRRHSLFSIVVSRSEDVPESMIKTL
ncbi:MAG: DoxX family protein [Mariniblastus sp.]